MVAHEEKEELVKTTVSLSPAGDIIGQWTILTVPKAVDKVGCMVYTSVLPIQSTIGAGAHEVADLLEKIC